MPRYIRPLVQMGPARPAEALTLAGGAGWFTHVEALHRRSASETLPASTLSSDERRVLTQPRAPIVGLDFTTPVLMGILNTTPDSFSDGGQHNSLVAAITTAKGMVQSGAHLIDIGGESTRPGALLIDDTEEITRTAPAVKGIRSAGIDAPISIDTRKAGVAEAALNAGANIVNDVSGFTFDPDLAALCVKTQTPVCVMHAQGDPATMQDNPHYENVLLDVYDHLAERIQMLIHLGIPQSHIIADPGIGFGKTLQHNLTLLQNISLLHSLGVPILLGTSRKKFIGTIGNQPQADKRGPGSIGTALAALSQGVQIIRAHDVADHAQAIALWRASMAQGDYE